MTWLSDSKCCHLAIHYVLPKWLPSPNLHFRFMIICIHTSLLGSLRATFLVILVDEKSMRFIKDLSIRESIVVIKVAWFYRGRLRPRVLRIKTNFVLWHFWAKYRTLLISYSDWVDVDLIRRIYMKKKKSG